MKATEHKLRGNKLFQERAREALPLLVRQAKAEQPICYSDLAEELSMPNPRNLDHVLGYIGEALQELGERWKCTIPPIQSLVVGKYTRVPGEGFWGIVKDRKVFANSSLKQKRLVVQQMLQEIYHFDQWDEVLREYGLRPLKNQWTRIPREVFRSRYGGSGESEEHKRLKEYISRSPLVLGLNLTLGKGEIEHEFPSADAVDVLFIRGQKWIGIEVKAKNSPLEDIARGIYQCVKYRALIEAQQMVEQKRPNAEVYLALGAKFPKDLIGLRNTLGINVIDNITVR